MSDIIHNLLTDTYIELQGKIMILKNNMEKYVKNLSTLEVS